MVKKLQINKSINFFHKWWFWWTTVFLLFTLSTMAGNYFYAQAHQNKIFSGLKINNIDIGKLSEAQAYDLLQKRVDQFKAAGLTYQYSDKQIQLPLIISAAADPDIFYQLINFDLEKTLAAAVNYGRSGNYLNDFIYRAKAFLVGQNINLDYTLNNDELLKILENNFGEFVEPPLNAGYQIISDEIKITEAKAGNNFNYQAVLKTTEEQINNFNNQKITLSLIAENPDVYPENISQEMIKEIAQLITWPKITFYYQEEKWEIEKDIFQNWVVAAKKGQQFLNQFSDDLLSDYLAKNIAPSIDQPVLEAKFNLENGRVKEFQAGSSGRQLMIADSLININREVFDNKNDSIELKITITSAKSQVGNINDLGIREIIGIGQSNFKGSPPNRIHNIRVGADTLNGILIEPNETFSLIKALGAIDASSGYKQELVIKGDKTIPEYGGGLCQIGTTTFRAALGSGLPIVERKNHAYRVVYYEPAGTDATIYDPKPDMRFLNDTGHYILLQTKISGNDLTFEFWGTKDGRLIEQTKSVIYNIVSPGPKRLIESEDLEPGEQKCIEHPHNGADAYFNYKVTYPNGEVKDETFRSHYVPWPEVCLIGKEPTLPEGENQTPTSTPETNING